MKTPPSAGKVASEPFAVVPNPDPVKDVSGDLVIYETAVASIVKRTVSSIEGVSRLSGNSFVDNIAEIVRSRKIQDRSIMLKFSGDSVSVDLSIVLYFGYKIPEVAAQIQNKTADAVFRMTGLKVSCININVRSIEEMTDDEKTETEKKQEGV